MVIAEAKFTKPLIMFHGTTTKYLSSILANGIIPNPKEGPWKKEDEVSAGQSSRQSLFGSYWTDNLSTAYGASGNASRNQGGEKIIVIAQIIPSSGFADEDDVKFSISREFNNSAGKEIGVFSSERAWNLKGLIDVEPETYSKMINDFSNNLHNRLTKNKKMPLDTILFKNTFDAYLERLLAHQLKTDERSKWKYVDMPDKILGREGGKKAIEDFDNIAADYKDISGSEKKYLEIQDKISRRYKESTNPNSYDDEAGYLQKFHTNARIPNPVKFKGNNRIIGIVLIPKINDEVPKWKQEPLRLLYGTISQEFIDGYKKFSGPNFQILDKNGKVIYSSQ